MRHKKIQILMPMAGRGSRFKIDDTPRIKPLIDVNGIPMFIKTLSSFDSLNINKEYFFVVNSIDNRGHQIEDTISKYLKDYKLIELENYTRGPLETCFFAKEMIDPDLPLIIMDCDFYFKSESFFKTITNLNQEDIFGGLIYFKESNNRYSYVKFDDSGFATETAEKKVISKNALAGAYLFKYADDFFKEADLEIKNYKENELFIAPMYNKFIKDGAKIKTHKVDLYYSYGTPEELKISTNKN